MHGTGSESIVQQNVHMGNLHVEDEAAQVETATQVRRQHSTGDLSTELTAVGHDPKDLG